MTKKKKTVSTYGIVGLGCFGRALALEIAKTGREILVVDTDEEKVRDLREYTENAFVVRSYDKKSLSATGIQNCSTAIVCIDDHVDMSILVTLHLTTMNIPRVIARSSSEEEGQILDKLGAEVVYPEHDMALRLARRLEPSKVMNYIELSEEIDISKVDVPDSLEGKTVLEANLREKYGLNIIAIDNGENLTTEIKPKYVFTEYDSLIVVGKTENIRKFSNK